MKKAKRVEGKGKRDEINEIKQIIKRMRENVGILKGINEISQKQKEDRFSRKLTS